MTLRTTAIIAGVIGLLMLIAGLVANESRPDREVLTTGTLETPVIVVGPEVMALQGLNRITVTADGAVEAHSTRGVDAAAWLKRHSATYVVGYAGWDTLATRTQSRVVTPSATPSPSPSPSESASPAATVEPTEAPTVAEGEVELAADNGSADDWRASWRGLDRVSIAVDAVAPGETFVVFSADGSDLKNVQFTAIRQVNDGWINPLIWIGAALAALGALAALSGLIDTRPVQARVEAWSRARSKADADADADARPGSRRERRLAGSTVPRSASALGEPGVDGVDGAEGADEPTTDDPTTDDPTEDKGGAL